MGRGRRPTEPIASLASSPPLLSIPHSSSSQPCIQLPPNDHPAVADGFCCKKVVLLASSGPVFSSGHDFKDFAGTPEAHRRAVLDCCASVNLLLRRVPQVRDCYLW
jgi:hypothetical protein